MIDVYHIWEKVEKTTSGNWEECKLKFAQLIVEENDTPDNCFWCRMCDRINYCCFLDVHCTREINPNRPICTIIDFLKYLLENI